MNVIYSIDNGQCPFRINNFKNFCAEQGIFIKQLIGSYKGEVEYSYLSTVEGFEKIRDATVWVEDQESYLYVTSCNKQYAKLVFNNIPGKSDLPLGSMKSVTEQEARQEDGWTFDPATNNYFICAHGNPDGMSKGDREQRALWDAIDNLLYIHVGLEGKSRSYDKLAEVRDAQRPKHLEKTI